ncbi:MAG: rod shape-determining protein MreD [Anaerolineae bacterium]|nr:rod shape-determining protein MreD [Anaerolineae bacterium]
MSLQLGFPLMLSAVLIQAVILPRMRMYGGQLDLVVILVLAWAILDHRQEGMVWAFIGGLCLDLFSGAPLGISSLVLVPIAYLISLTEAQVYRTNALLPLLLAGCGTLAYHAGYLLAIRFLAGMSVAWLHVIWYVTLPSLLFDIIAIMPVLWILRPWYDRLHPQQMRI